MSSNLWCGSPTNRYKFTCPLLTHLYHKIIFLTKIG